jgi:hypothetical protein
LVKSLPRGRDRAGMGLRNCRFAAPASSRPSVHGVCDKVHCDMAGIVV